MRDDKLIEAMAIAIHEQAWGPWEEADDGERTDARDSARAALAALQETHAVVPREPTPEMRSEFERWYSENGQHMDAVERLGDGYHLGRTQFAWMAWKEAWIAAAPAPQTEEPRGINVSGHTYVRRSATSYVCRRCGHDMCREEPKPCANPQPEEAL